MRLVTTLAAVLALSGCIGMQRQTAWSKQGEMPGERATAIAECDLEAIKHAGSGDPSMRTAIGQGIELGMRRNEIFSACMKAKGWW